MNDFQIFISNFAVTQRPLSIIHLYCIPIPDDVYLYLNSLNMEDNNTDLMRLMGFVGILLSFTLLLIKRVKAMIHSQLLCMNSLRFSIWMRQLGIVS